MKVAMKMSGFTILNEPLIIWGSQKIRKNNFNQKRAFQQYFDIFPFQIPENTVAIVLLFS